MTTLNAKLVAVLKTVCAQVHPNTAAWATPRPYLVYQRLGGEVWDYEDNTPSAEQHASVQVTAWADTDAGALALITAVEAALRGAATVVAWPDSQPRDDSAADLGRFAYSQDFGIYASSA